MREIKLFLREWGFHHCYGVWVSNDSHNIKAIITKAKKDKRTVYYISFSKDGFNYLEHNKFLFDESEKQHCDAIKEDIIKRLMNWI